MRCFFTRNVGGFGASFGGDFGEFLVRNLVRIQARISPRILANFRAFFAQISARISPRNFAKSPAIFAAIFAFALAGCAQKLPPAPAIFADEFPQKAAILPPLDAPETFDKAAFLAKFFELWSKPKAEFNGNYDWGLRYYKAEKTYYTLSNIPLPESFFAAVRANANFAALNSVLAPALVVRNTPLRNLPTRTKIFTAPKSYPFDRAQDSVLAIFSPVRVSHYSRDGLWAFVHSDAVSGWVWRGDVRVLSRREVREFAKFEFGVFTRDGGAIVRVADAKNAAKNAKNSAKKGAKNVKNSRASGANSGAAGVADRANSRAAGVADRANSRVDFATIFPDGDFIGQTRVGGFFPFERETADAFIWRDIRIPKAFAARFGEFADGAVRARLDALIGQSYGWGGENLLRDCSLFVKDFFASFGLWLPRNSGAQKAVGTAFDLRGMSNELKREMLVRYGVPYKTLLWLPGHIMLYTGVVGGEIDAVELGGENGGAGGANSNLAGTGGKSGGKNSRDKTTAQTANPRGANKTPRENLTAAHAIWALKDASGNRHAIGKTAITTLELGRGFADFGDENLLLGRVQSFNILEASFE